MSTTSGDEIRLERRFEATPERVFDAWLEPKRAGLWLFATPTGERVRVQIDARVGGAFSIVERRDGVDVDHVGTYLEIDRPRRLVFRFGVPRFSPDTSTVAVEIQPLGAGCTLVLTLHGVLPEWADRTRQGWTTLLGGLEATLDVP